MSFWQSSPSFLQRWLTYECTPYCKQSKTCSPTKDVCVRCVCMVQLLQNWGMRRHSKKDRAVSGNLSRVVVDLPRESIDGKFDFFVTFGAIDEEQTAMVHWRFLKTFLKTGRQLKQGSISYMRVAFWPATETFWRQLQHEISICSLFLCSFTRLSVEKWTGRLLKILSNSKAIQLMFNDWKRRLSLETLFATGAKDMATCVKTNAERGKRPRWRINE